MVGKKKKKEKHLGLSLPRIGPSLVPNAVFTAVPGTAQRLSETWPRKCKTISSLVTALGSVGNIAQAVVVGASPREEFEKIADSSSDEYSSEDDSDDPHYAKVDNNMRSKISSHSEGNGVEENGHSAKINEDVVYATVNKRRKPQETEEMGISSEEDITDVSGMYSSDEYSVYDNESSIHEHKEHDHSQKKKNSKRKSKKHSPQHILPVEEHVTKSYINDNFITNAADVPDGFLADNNDYEATINKLDQNENEQDSRDYYQQNAFEREMFNETTFESSRESTLNNSRTREDKLLGASAPDMTDNIAEVPLADKRETPDLNNYPPEVPPIGERETPIGKGQSSESIGALKENSHPEQLKPKHQSKHSKKKKQRNDKQTTNVEQNIVGDGEKNKEKGQLNVKEKLNVIDDSQHLTVNSSEDIAHTQNVQNETEKPRETISSEQLRLRKLEHSPYEYTQSEQVVIVRESKTKDKKKSKNKGEFSKVVDQIVTSNYLPHMKYEEEHGEEIQETKQVINDKETKKNSKKHRRKRIDSESAGQLSTPSPSYHTVESLQQMTVAKETCRKLRRQVKVLDQEKSALESLSQSLNHENQTLKKLTESLTNKPESVTTFSLVQLQNEELKNENNFLKDSVRRLNMELGRYQAKFRPLPPQEVDTMFQSGERHPPWLMDKKYLAPLLLAYDDQIKEKQNIIKAYEDELQKFKKRVEEIVQENIELREGLGKSQMLSHNNEECMQLEEQAQLVLKENALLMERQEMQTNKMEEIKTIYKEEVSRLSKLYTTTESERDVLKSKLEAMTSTLHEVQQELGNTSTEWKKRISVEDHVEIVNECRRKLEALKKNTEEEIDSLKFKLEAAQKENDNLAAQQADYKLVNIQLEREVHKFQEIQRKRERKTLLLKEKLSHVQEREITTQDTLSEVLKIAEKTSAERDLLNEKLANKQSEQKKAQSLVKREEDKLKECKNKAYNKIAAFKGRVKEQEKATEMLKDCYENEINTLKVFIRRQQRQLEDMMSDKQNLENELNDIYQNIDGDATTKVT